MDLVNYLDNFLACGHVWCFVHTCSLQQNLYPIRVNSFYLVFGGSGLRLLERTSQLLLYNINMKFKHGCNQP